MKHKKKISRISWQFIMLILLTIVLPSLVFFVYIVNRYSNDLLDRAIITRQSVLEEINRCIKLQFEDYQELSMTIYYDDEIKSLINSGDYSDPSPKQLEYLEKSMLAIINSKYNVDKIMLCFGDRVYEYGRTFSGMEEFREKYEPSVLAKEGRCIWLPTEIMQGALYRKPKDFVLARAINNENTNVGIFYLFLSDNFFSRIMTNDVLTSDNSHYYIIGQGGQIVASDTNTVGTAAHLPFDTDMMTGETGYFTLTDNGREEVITYSKMKLTGWTSIIVSDSSAIFANARQIEKIAAIFMTVFVLALILAYYITNRTIIEPVYRLYDGIRHVSEGQFERVALPKANNEVKQLTEGFNDMVSNMQSLLQRVRDEEAEKNRQRLKVLYMQIGPHFLYNTLNSIKWMAVLNNQTNIKLMLDSLMKLMAGVAYNEEDNISLAKEIELLDKYIYIQKIRFTNFSVEYHIPDELMNCRIGRFMLQPFVENSILHGLRGVNYPGMISVSAWADNGLCVEIRDNGRGYDPSAVTEKTENEDKKDHIGIKNVQERIHINYGDDYGVRIESKPGEGTRVVLRVPLTEEGDHGESSDS